MIQVKLPDGSIKEYPDESTAVDVAESNKTWILARKIWVDKEEAGGTQTILRGHTRIS